MRKSDQAGRFDRGARWHLILTAALLIFAVSSTIYRFTLPTDGWLSVEPEGFDSYGFIYQRDIMDRLRLCSQAITWLPSGAFR